MFAFLPFKKSRYHPSAKLLSVFSPIDAIVLQLSLSVLLVLQASITSVTLHCDISVHHANEITVKHKSQINNYFLNCPNQNNKLYLNDYELSVFE